jgi:hypothetical protein
MHKQTGRWPDKPPFIFQNEKSRQKIQCRKGRKLEKGMEYAFGQNIEYRK